jgi:hypothetical protein
LPVCPICRRDLPDDLLHPADLVVTAEIRTQNDFWKESDGICAACLKEYERRVSG